jgi:hypothetical protein
MRRRIHAYHIRTYEEEDTCISYKENEGVEKERARVR